MYVVQSSSYLRISEHTDGFQLHTHEGMIEAEVMISGGGYQKLNGRTYRIKRGCVTIVRPQDFHEVTLDAKTRLINMQFHPSFLSRDLLALLLDAQGDLVADLSEEGSTLALSLAEGSLEEFQNASSFSHDIIKRQLEHLCYLLLRKRSVSQKQKKNESDSNSLIEKALLFMRTGFAENPSLQTTAHFVHLNSDYFALLFKKYTGRTYYSYLTELKMEHAKKLTIESDLPIAVICAKAGFGHEANFHRQFKRYFGMSAGKMRKNFQKEEGTE